MWQLMEAGEEDTGCRERERWMMSLERRLTLLLNHVVYARGVIWMQLATQVNISKRWF